MHIAKHRTDDQASASCELHRARSDGVLCGKRTLGALVRHKFQAADQTKTARFADQRMRIKRFQPRLKLNASLGGFLNDAVTRIDFDRLERDCRPTPDARHT